MSLPKTLYVSLKRAEKLDWSSPLKKYIMHNYSAEDFKTNSEGLNELNALRQRVKNLETASETSLEILYQYYLLLLALEKRFPINEQPGSVSLNFAWKDCFKDKKFTSQELGFEKASVLFNAAAIYTRFGYQNNRLTPEGLKASCQQYCQAAGVFQFICNSIPGRVISVDLTDDVLSAFVHICLAHAQEGYLETAARGGKVGSTLMAKLAMQVHEHFSCAYQLFNHGEVATYASRAWLNQLNALALYYSGIAHMYAGKGCGEADNYGVEIAYLQKSVSLLEESLKIMGKNCPENCEPVTTMLSQVREKLKLAIKDNNDIYIAVVPDVQTLAPIEAKPVAKPAPMLELESIYGVRDPFVSLVPHAVQQALADYEEKKKTLLQHEYADMDEQTNLARSMLASMGLPAKVERAKGETGSGNTALPPTLQTTMRTAKEEGGINYLLELSTTLEELRNTDRDILNEAVEKLAQEEAEDTEQRTAFGSDQWVRKPSAQLNKGLKEEGVRYRATLDQATAADTTVQTKLQQNKKKIERLCVAEVELGLSAPAKKVMNPELAQLEALLQEIDSVLAHRQQLKDRMGFTAQTDDIRGQIMSGEGSPEAVMTKGLEKYGDMRKEKEASFAQQTDLLEKIRNACDAYDRTLTSLSEAEAHDQAIFTELEAASNTYEELKGHLREGVQFYSQFQDILSKYCNKSKSFVAARNVEKKDLVQHIQEKLAAVTIADTPQPPQGYSPTPPAQSQKRRAVPSPPQPQQQPSPNPYQHSHHYAPPSGYGRPDAGSSAAM